MSEAKVGGACTVVGSWNPAILQPDWLQKAGIIPEEAVHLEIQIGTGSHVFQFRTGGFLWRCSVDRLEVLVEDIKFDPGEKVALVLNALEHTPVRAIGNNFYFTGDLVNKIDGNHFFDQRVVEQLTIMSFTVTSRSMQISLASNLADALVNLKLNSNGQQVTKVEFNFHRETPNAGLAARMASQWKKDLLLANSILQALHAI